MLSSYRKGFEEDSERICERTEVIGSYGNALVLLLVKYVNLLLYCFKTSSIFHSPIFLRGMFLRSKNNGILCMLYLFYFRTNCELQNMTFPYFGTQETLVLTSARRSYFKYRYISYGSIVFDTAVHIPSLK